MNKRREDHLSVCEKALWLELQSIITGATVDSVIFFIQSIRVNNTSWNNVLFPECGFKECVRMMLLLLWLQNHLKK